LKHDRLSVLAGDFKFQELTPATPATTPATNSFGYFRGSGSRTSHKSGAFTLIEVLVTMAIVVTLVSMLIPGLRMAKSRADELACSNNLRQFGVALVMYQTDHTYYPSAYDGGWNNYQTYLAPYMKVNTFNPRWDATRVERKHICRSIFKKYEGSPYTDYWGYGYNESISRDTFYTTPPIFAVAETHFWGYVAHADALVPQPARKIAMFCNANGNNWLYAGSGWNITAFPGYPSSWLAAPEGIHSGRDNYLYCDGHVASYALDEKDLFNAAWFANTKTSPYQY
jgi:prepilin-type processing-associated H-X9-DG protein/prepilin-type N-terminal cleavage/methylation domain-containing protein